jgi:hypothetical protein
MDTFLAAAIMLIAKRMGITYEEIKAQEKLILGKWAGLEFSQCYLRYFNWKKSEK